MEPLEASATQQKGGGVALISNDDEAEGFLPEQDTSLERSNATLLQRLTTYCNSYQVAELVFCLIVFFLGFLLEFAGVEPRQRAIPYQELSTGEFALNQMYDLEFRSETISTVELLVYGVLLPFIIQFLLSYFSERPSSCHNTICVYLATVGITILTTDALKLYVGYLRPIFYDQCVPDDQYQTCTGEDEQEVRKSFPSGHSSTSFCGLGLLSFYLEKRFGASQFRNVGSNTSTITPPTAKSLAMARMLSVASKTPLLLAGYISTSRLVDNKHHPADVVGGAVLGLSVALWIHTIWYNHF